MQLHDTKQLVGQEEAVLLFFTQGSPRSHAGASMPLS